MLLLLLRLLEHFTTVRVLFGGMLTLLRLKVLQVADDLVDLLLDVEEVVGDLLFLGHPLLSLLFDGA